MPAGGTGQIRVWQPGSWLGQGQIEREGHVALYKWSKFKKKKKRRRNKAVNYFAEFSLNSRFLFTAVIFFPDNGPTHLVFFFVLMSSPGIKEGSLFNVNHRSFM